MSEHIGGANKMVANTPRTDAADWSFYVMRNESKSIERELNAANERIKRLEEFLADVSKQWECDCWYNTGPECKCCRAEELLKEAKP